MARFSKENRRCFVGLLLLLGSMLQNASSTVPSSSSTLRNDKLSLQNSTKIVTRAKKKTKNNILTESNNETKRKPKPTLLAKKGGSSSKSDTLRRIQREWKDLVENNCAYNWKEGKPIKFKCKQHIWIGPVHSSLLVWHFTLVGIPNSAFANGLYHGRLILPENYPAAPPHVQVWTPSGRFLTRQDICITASNYHPELWTTNWTIRTILEALRLHFLTQANEIGGINDSYEERLSRARLSREFRCKVPISSSNIVSIDHAAMLEQDIFADIEPTEVAMSDVNTCVDEDISDGSEPVANISSGHGEQRPLLSDARWRSHQVKPKASERSLLLTVVRNVLRYPLLLGLFVLFCYLNSRS